MLHVEVLGTAAGCAVEGERLDVTCPPKTSPRILMESRAPTAGTEQVSGQEGSADRERLDTLWEAQVLVEWWRRDYDLVRPHSALGRRPQPPRHFKGIIGLRSY